MAAKIIATSKGKEVADADRRRGTTSEKISLPRREAKQQDVLIKAKDKAVKILEEARIEESVRPKS